MWVGDTYAQTFPSENGELYVTGFEGDGNNMTAEWNGWYESS